jgi:hypothetical protein
VFERLTDRLTRLLGRRKRGNATDGGPSPDRRTSRLFRCESCEAVYVARTKETGGTCGTGVTRIRSTLSGGSDDESTDEG